MPQVSVIVPNYNHAPYLRQRIESILTQTFQDFELILLDDCSTDNSREILAEYARHPKVSGINCNDKNSGSPFVQWQKGIVLAKGEYVWIAESDDWAEDNFLEVVLSEIQRNPDVGVAYTASTLIDEQGICTYANKENNSGEVIFFQGINYLNTHMLTGNAIWNASMMVFRKNLMYYVQNNEYEQMTYCGDWFLYVQLIKNSNIIEIKKTLNHYRKHGANISNNALKTGLFFTEGFFVFRYISNIKGITVSQQTLFLWAKLFYKENHRYSFNLQTKHEIVISFLRYNPLLIVYTIFYTLIKKIKSIL